MNDLFSSLFSRFRNKKQSPRSHHIEMSSGNSPTTTGGVNLDKFFEFEDVESIKEELKDLETLYNQLQSSNDHSETLHNAKSIKDLRSKMDNDVSSSLKKAKKIKVRLEGLDRSNGANRSLPGCAPGSSSDPTRTLVVNGLRKKLQDSMNLFNDLRQRMALEYQETVQRHYFTVTGENADKSMVDTLIETGQSKTFLQKAIQEQGRGQVIAHLRVVQQFEVIASFLQK